jgi:hypothetical protein
LRAAGGGTDGRDDVLPPSGEEEEAPAPTRKQKRKRRSKARKKSTAKKKKKKRGSGFIDVYGVEKATGPDGREMSSCMQDAALNGAKQMGVDIDPKTMYKQCPPRRTKHTMVAEIESAPCVEEAIQLKYENHHHTKGGPEYALLQVRTGGPRFVIGTVEGRKETEHAFIYDPTGILPGPYRAHMGILIDNRGKAPVRIIEESDRSSVDMSRQAIDSFFTAKTFISQVYEMRPAAAEPGPKRHRRKKGINRFQSMGLWKSALTFNAAGIE